MLIVVMILVIFTGVIGINVAKSLREQKFNTEVSLIVERLRLCQNIMLVLNRDVRFKVRQAEREEGLEITLEVEGGIAKEWQFVLDRARMKLNTIHLFQFNDLLSLPIKQNEVEIRFLSGGTVMSRGVIHLSTHENSNESGAINSAIILYGYPHPIQSVNEKDKPVVLEEEDYGEDIRLTNYTVEELKQYEENKKAKQKQMQQDKIQQNPLKEGQKAPAAS
jgi:hypothetical protein